MAKDTGKEGNKGPKVPEVVTTIRIKLMVVNNQFFVKVTVLSQHKRLLEKQLVNLLEKGHGDQFNQLDSERTNEDGIVQFPIKFASPTLHLCIECGGVEEPRTFKSSDASSRQEIPKELQGHPLAAFFKGFWKGGRVS